MKAPKGRHTRRVVPPLWGFVSYASKPRACALGYYPTPLRGEGNETVRHSVASYFLNSHTFALLSALPVAIISPPGLNATAVTASV